MKMGSETKPWAHAARVLALCGALLVAACGGGGSDGVTGGGGNPTAALSLFAGNSTSVNRLGEPNGVALDADGNVYVADTNNNLIRKITAAGVVTTLAGSGTGGFADGTGTAAAFDGPRGIAVDASGVVYVADSGNHRIRKISAAGEVTTLAGSGSPGFANDTTGTLASFNNPSGIAVDASGVVYVADSSNHRIRKITADGEVTTLAGSGSPGSIDDTGTAASFDGPRGIAVDASGVVHVADSNNHSIRKITAAGEVSTLAGSVMAGSTDATGSAASFNDPHGVAVDAFGVVYVADSSNTRIRKITAAGEVTTLAGSSYGSADGAGAAAKFSNPRAIAVDPSGNLYVADTNNNLIRKIDSSANVSTFAGETNGAVNGQASVARFSTQGNNIGGLSADAAGNVYVADTQNHLIRKITPAGVVSTLAGSGSPGSTDDMGAAASFNTPRGVAVDAFGVVYVADSGNNLIRKITAAGEVTTLAGSGSPGSANNVTGTLASFDNPFGIAVDAAGNVYVADAANASIRKITAAGEVTTLAGASFSYPTGVAVDAAGNVYVSDNGGDRISKVTSGGVVTVLAGSGTSASVDGTGTGASFTLPTGIVIDATGNLYVTEADTHLIRKVTPAGVVTTLVGQANQSGFTPGALPGLIHQPSGIAVSGNDLYLTVGSTGIVKVSNGARP
nr:NHL repeat-containing protein [uncultured Aquabacterium sp.]